MIWNKDAVDYSKGVRIVDCLTGFEYSEAEARRQSVEVKKRLILTPNKVGCWVYE